MILATTATLVAGLAVVPFMGESLFPTFKERDFLALWVTRPSTGHQEIVRITQRASRDFRAIPGVRGFGAHIGRAVQGEEINGINFAEDWLSLSPDADYGKTLDRIRQTVDAYPGLFREQTTYLNERIDEVLAGSSEAVTVRIFGPDLNVLRDKAEQVHDALRGIKGVVDLRTELQVDVPYISVEPDLEKAARYGLKPGDIRREAAVIVAGEEVSDLHVDGKVYDVIAWSTPQARRDVQSIRDLPLDTPGGGHVRLADVADVHIGSTPNQISREDNSRRIDVGLNVHGRDLGSVVHDVNERLAELRFPREYHAEVLGEFAERQAAAGRLLAFGVAAAIGIFLLLQTCIGSWRVATFSFLTLPLALVGGAAGGVRRGRADLARLAGRLPDRVRHRGPKRDPAHQPLPAPRAGGGPAVRARPRPARLARAARADPDDGARDRPRARAAGDLGRDPRAPRSSTRWRSSSSAAWPPRRC